MPIYKNKGEKLIDRTILNIGYNVLAPIIKNRTHGNMDKEIGEYQTGSRDGRSLMGQIFTIRESEPESREYNHERFVLFIDV